MTYQEALKKEKKWHRKAMIIHLFHNTMLLRKKKWNLRATAKRLGISLGAVCEARKLAQAILANPELELLRRDEALERIK